MDLRVTVGVVGEHVDVHSGPPVTGPAGAAARSNASSCVDAVRPWGASTILVPGPKREGPKCVRARGRGTLYLRLRILTGIGTVSRRSVLACGREHTDPAAASRRGE